MRLFSLCGRQSVASGGYQDPEAGATRTHTDEQRVAAQMLVRADHRGWRGSFENVDGAGDHKDGNDE